MIDASHSRSDGSDGSVDFGLACARARAEEPYGGFGRMRQLLTRGVGGLNPHEEAGQQPHMVSRADFFCSRKLLISFPEIKEIKGRPNKFESDFKAPQRSHARNPRFVFRTYRGCELRKNAAKFPRGGWIAP